MGRRKATHFGKGAADINLVRQALDPEGRRLSYMLILLPQLRILPRGYSINAQKHSLRELEA